MCATPMQTHVIIYKNCWISDNDCTIKYYVCVPFRRFNNLFNLFGVYRNDKNKKKVSAKVFSSFTFFSSFYMERVCEAEFKIHRKQISAVFYGTFLLCIGIEGRRIFIRISFSFSVLHLSLDFFYLPLHFWNHSF